MYTFYKETYYKESENIPQIPSSGLKKVNILEV